jgi:hypothetical protein
MTSKPLTAIWAERVMVGPSVPVAKAAYLCYLELATKMTKATLHPNERKIVEVINGLCFGAIEALNPRRLGVLRPGASHHSGGQAWFGPRACCRSE